MTPAEQITKLEEEIKLLKERNKRVESDKAWETSRLRKLSIAVVTYVIVALTLRVEGIDNFFIGATIPHIGYLLSTLTLPFVKKWWVTTFFIKK